MQFILKIVVGFLLRLINPSKPKGKYLYEGVARHMVGVAFEAVLLKEINGVLHVFLTRREPGQSYAGKWTLPGTILRPSDKTMQDAARRVMQGELGCDVYGITPVTMEPHLWQEERGRILSILHFVTFGGKPSIYAGKWHPTNFLPEDTLALHQTFITVAASEKRKGDSAAA